VNRPLNGCGAEEETEKEEKEQDDDDDDDDDEYDDILNFTHRLHLQLFHVNLKHKTSEDFSSYAALTGGHTMCFHCMFGTKCLYFILMLHLKRLHQVCNGI